MAVVRKKQRLQARSRESISLEKPAGNVTPKGILRLAEDRGIKVNPLDIEGLLKAYEVNIRRRPMEDEISGHLEATEDGWYVTINSLHHPRRQRFTLAHELGHFLLHSGERKDFLDRMLFRANEQSRMETEANRFAASLLMPEEEFKRFVNQHSSKVEDIAEHFQVSALAVRVRAKELGFQNHGL
jgi:Zn-dependent peptidase ImmA (M78 family)